MFELLNHLVLITSLFIIIAQKSQRSIFRSLKISEMSLTILSYMHVVCRRADLVKKQALFEV